MRSPWDDRDLAIGLSRTYRWGGHSRWDLPMSVAQHSLLVLVLRQQMQPHRRLTPREALREMLHDGEEACIHSGAGSEAEGKEAWNDLRLTRRSDRGSGPAPARWCRTVAILSLGNGAVGVIQQ